MNKNKIKEGINLEERVYLNYHTYGEALSVDFGIRVCIREAEWWH